MHQDESSISLLCFNTGIRNRLSSDDIKLSKLELKREINNASVLFWTELKGPIFHSINEVSLYLEDPRKQESWEGLASIKSISCMRKNSRQHIPTWLTTQQDVSLMWNTNIWEEVLFTMSHTDSVDGTLNALGKPQVPGQMSKIMHYPPSFPSERVAWTLLRRVGEKFAHRLYAFATFHGIQNNATTMEKQNLIQQLFSFFDKNVCRKMKIPVIIGGDFNASPSQIVDWTKELQINMEGIIPNANGDVLNTTREKCLDHIWTLNPGITEGKPSMHVKSIESELSPSFHKPPCSLEHLPFRARILGFDMIHPGTHIIGQKDTKRFLKHLSAFWDRESEYRMNASDRFCFSGNAQELSNLILQGLQKHLKDLQGAPLCQHECHATYVKYNRSDLPAQEDPKSEHPKKLPKSLREILLERVFFVDYQNNGTNWKMDFIDHLLATLSHQKKSILLKALENNKALEIKCDWTKKNIELQWLVSSKNERCTVKAFLDSLLRETSIDEARAAD